MIEILIPYYKQYPYLINVFDFWRDILIGFQILIVFLYLSNSKNYKIFFVYFLTFIFTFIVGEIIKNFVPSLRPLSIHFSNWQLNNSFPSNHTMISTVLSLLLVFDNFGLSLFSFSLTILIALFSYFSLMHSFIDILGGFFLAILIVFFVKKIDHIFFKLFILIKEKRNSK